ncbi:MAG: hypothetical protein QUS11_06600 [Candidatus Fermentibacter sp.]|nr:hypothetical protein [Candidatus Fermentibacter sp.]
MNPIDADVHFRIDILHRLNRLRLCAKRGGYDLPPRDDLALILGCSRAQLDRVMDSEHSVVFGEIKLVVGEIRDGSRLTWLLPMSLPDLKHVLALVSSARDTVLQELERVYHTAAEAEFGDRARTWTKAEQHVAALRVRCAKSGDL